MLDRKEVFEWIDGALEHGAAENIAAFCFNLYDDGDNMWSMELVGTSIFDADDDDWACEEITDFNTRSRPFVWKTSEPWEKVLEEAASEIKAYLVQGKYMNVLKSRRGVGVGFVDGDLQILYAEQ